MLDALRAAHACARERFWELSGAAQSLTIDVDGTLITAHSEKENAAGNYKHGYGFHFDQRSGTRHGVPAWHPEPAAVIAER